MKSIKIIITSLVILLFFQTKLFAEIRYVDFKYVLNESKAGKEAQIYLKKKLDNGIKDLKAKEKSIQEEEKKIRHHLYGIVDAKKNFSTGQWLKLALKKIKSIIAANLIILQSIHHQQVMKFL